MLFRQRLLKELYDLPTTKNVTYFTSIMHCFSIQSQHQQVQKVETEACLLFVSFFPLDKCRSVLHANIDNIDVSPRQRRKKDFYNLHLIKADVLWKEKSS